MRLSRIVTTLFLAVCSAGANAHELWIEPEQWQAPPAAEINANLVNGENFSGRRLAWKDRSTLRAERWDSDGSAPITGQPGDRPAFATTAPRDGLVTLLYQSTHKTVTYSDYDDFAGFLAEKGFEPLLQRHDERRLPPAPVKEAYARFSKALVGAGSGQGADAPRGLELEIVALSNPYTQPADSDLRFQVLYRGDRLADNRVTVFRRDGAGTVETFHMQTDPAGTVAFKPEAGMVYLVDTVMIREPDRALVAETRGAVWESLWASLTFRAPEPQ
jgi:uncharacterized protein DUF4198|tara:strand:+ start:21635 stop:22456 length:822 start_codon:yes stop_codon:yes gene_type:complete